MGILKKTDKSETLESNSCFLFLSKAEQENIKEMTIFLPFKIKFVALKKQ